jgi:hypothetical protein
MTEPKRPRVAKDIAILNGPTDDGHGARVVRIREGEVSAGEIRPVRQGESINHSEVVRLRPLDREQRVCEIEVLHAPNADANAHDPAKAQAKGEAAQAGQAAQAGTDALRRRNQTPGPVRVSNPTYRKNWSAIFDSKGKSDEPDWSVN